MPGTVQQELTRIIGGLRADGVKSVCLAPDNEAAIRNPRPAQTLRKPQTPAPAVPVQTPTAARPAPVAPAAPHIVQPAPVLTPAPVAEEPLPADFQARVKAADWNGLREMTASCRLCPLHATCMGRLFAAGAGKATVAFVGDAPFAEEAASGRSFAGPAGEMLFKMGQAMKLDWEGGSRAAAVVNVLKCRPSTPPGPRSLEICSVYLKRQLELLQPSFLVLLGYLPAKVLTGASGFASIKGTWLEYGGLPAMVIQNPAQIMRFAGNQEMFRKERSDAWQSLQAVMARMNA